LSPYRSWSLSPWVASGITSALVHASQRVRYPETIYSQRYIHILTYYVLDRHITADESTGVREQRLVNRTAIAEKL